MDTSRTRSFSARSIDLCAAEFLAEDLFFKLSSPFSIIKCLSVVILASALRAVSLKLCLSDLTNKAGFLLIPGPRKTGQPVDRIRPSSPGECGNHRNLYYFSY